MKKVLLILSVFCMLLSTVGFIPSASAETTDCNCTVLEGDVAKEYIKIASKSAVYKNNVSNKKIKNAQAALFEKGEQFPENVVVVSGSVGNDEYNAVQIFITEDDNEIVRVTHITAEGVDSQDAFTLKSYDSEGYLRATSDGTINEMFEGTATVEKQDVPQEVSTAASDLWWACQFSSLFVCLGAAGVNVLLGLACRAAFKYFACSNL